MLEAAEYFAGLFADGLQPFLVFDREKKLCYRNPAAESLMKLMGAPDPAVFFTSSVQEEMQFCLAELRGAALTEKICDRVLPLQLMPLQYGEQTYLVMQICRRLADQKQEEVLRVMRISRAKLASCLNRIYCVTHTPSSDPKVGDEVAKSTRRILRLVRHLSLWTDTGERYQYRLPVNVGAFVTGFIRSVEEIVPQIKLYTAPCLSDLCARVMPEDLELVMGCLLSNALRFGNGGVQILALKTPEGIAVEFWDNGPGAEAPERLFQAGYRTFDRKGAMGAGFSLSVARQVMEIQGATLTYERVNDRTCFRILLQEETESFSRMAEWDFETENNLSQLRIELSDI